MAASVQFRPQNRDLGMVMREVDEDLAIFLGIQNGERGRNDRLLVEESDEFDYSKKSKPDDSLLALNSSQTGTASEMENIGCNWLIAQPDASLLPSVEKDEQDSATSQTNAISLKSKHENTCGLKPETSSGERKPMRRAATPTGRSSLPAKPKPSRSCTPPARSSFPSTKPSAAQPRSSTPRSSSSRSSTATPSSIASTKTGTTTSKSVGQSRGTSPTVKSRHTKPSVTLSLSQDATQNPKVTVPKRPVSASRGRLNERTVRSPSSNEKPRQKSCSPPRARAPLSTAYKTGSKMLSRSRNGDDDVVNPVVMGTKMVDRVVNMRKLVPPKQEECVSHDIPKKSSQENTGFGRSLSKTSLDMAIRHMAIRRSIRDKS